MHTKISLVLLTLSYALAACHDGTPATGPRDAGRMHDGALAPSDLAHPPGDAGCTQCGYDISNQSSLGMLIIAPQPSSATIKVNGTFDTDSACTASSIFGTCSKVTQTNGPPVCVCRAPAIEVIAPLTVTGTSALALLVEDGFVVDATATFTIKPGAGAWLVYPTSSTTSPAAGGGNGGLGGGEDTTDTVNSPLVVPLLGGSAGQSAAMATGGSGGGALQVSARRIDVSGSILAGGGGGIGGAITTSSESLAGGGGAGGGGAILLEAPTVDVSGTLGAAGGGGGGGGGNTKSGDDGTPGTATAGIGGAGDDGHGCGFSGSTVGGHGGDGALSANVPGTVGGPSDTRSCNPNAYLGAGGSGGGAGIIRINSNAGKLVGVVGPKASFGTLTLR